MSGKARPHLRAKTLENVKRSSLSQTDKDCIQAVFERLNPKKPKVDDEGWLCCPNCNETFAMFDNLNRRLLCCGCCGQKLDWSEVDAKKRSDTE